MRCHAFVHQGKPPTRKIRGDNHRAITGGQLWAVIKMAQTLKTTGGMCMMIGMALQLIEHQVGDDAVAVPAVGGCAAFVLTIGQFLPQ